jgi:hypothetical protein
MRKNKGVTILGRIYAINLVDDGYEIISQDFINDLETFITTNYNRYNSTYLHNIYNYIYKLISGLNGVKNNFKTRYRNLKSIKITPEDIFIFEESINIGSYNKKQLIEYIMNDLEKIFKQYKHPIDLKDDNLLDILKMEMDDKRFRYI